MNMIAAATAQIALHVSEFAAAGTDTTAQAMTNAVIFLAQHPEALQDAIDEPELWSRVFEETVRRRPSSSCSSIASGLTTPNVSSCWRSWAAR